MTASEDQFELFGQAYAAWKSQTQALPFRCNRTLPRGAFELDLDQLIDYLQPIMAAAADRSTKFDYAKVIGEYIHDLDLIKAELESASLGDPDRKAYLVYLTECRSLLGKLSSLPVAPEGYLGFRSSALHAFRFLISEHGFKVADTLPVRVLYTTGTMSVDLWHSPDCPMNSILVGKPKDSETSTSGFSLDDFAYVAGLGILFDYESFDLLDATGIAKFLQTAALLVRVNGSSLLRGDAKAFREFQSKADERERFYIEMMERQHLPL